MEPVLAADDAGVLAAQRMMLMSDLNMLVCTGGRERTEAEFAALLDAAGLRLDRRHAGAAADRVTRCCARSRR